MPPVGVIPAKAGIQTQLLGRRMPPAGVTPAKAGVQT